MKKLIELSRPMSDKEIRNKRKSVIKLLVQERNRGTISEPTFNVMLKQIMVTDIGDRMMKRIQKDMEKYL